ncbi:MAG: hypothetical protein V4692_12540, partial [Bdellovibrionota bacterium]
QTLMVAGLAVLSSVASAEPVSPTGIYSESQLRTGTESRAGVVGEVKTWVSSKIGSLKSLWGTEADVAHAPSQPSYNPPKSVTRTLEAPSTTAVRQVPVALPSRAPANSDVKVDRDSTGVAVFSIPETGKIPRLNIGEEDRISSSRYALDTKMQKVLDEKVLSPFVSADLMTEKDMKRLTVVTTGKTSPAHKVKVVEFKPKGVISRAAFDKIVRNLKPESPLKLAKFYELSADEMRFLSGLLLYQQGNQCSAAVGLFHKLSKKQEWQAEADYYLAMCSRKLGLETDFYERASRILESKDKYYSVKILKEVSPEVPYEFTERFGLALFKAVEQPKFFEGLDPKSQANVSFLLAEFGAATERFKTALTWARKVPADHSHHLKARFVEALSEYQAGSKDKALAMQEKLYTDLAVDKANMEFQALVALNTARMYYLEQRFKEAHESFLKVYKDHPLWLQSLTELGWSQILSGDYEGAIGNMYSIQSPFFGSVYKPESYVVRTIGYLNLCQYGDAYRTLSMLERDYRPSLDKMERYTSSKPDYYQTVRNFMALQQVEKKSKDKVLREVDGLPQPVVREMARHRDFTNLQKALNRQLDEQGLYVKLDGTVESKLKHAQWLVNNSRKRIDALRKSLASIKKKPELEQNRNTWLAQLNKEQFDLNGHFFQIDLYTEAKLAIPEYKSEVVGGAEKRLAKMKSNMQNILANRLVRMKTELARALDNNELLRYEVFAGSGENIRYQVAGGEKGNRVPASIIPKSKSLQWDFDGEYWEDEIGHYRSSLKNNCPEATQIQHASMGEE